MKHQKAKGLASFSVTSHLASQACHLGDSNRLIKTHVYLPVFLLPVYSVYPKLNLNTY